MNKIDYSQYSKFLFCPWAWYETYVKGMSPRYIGQRSDPLALGSLVHEGLDTFSRTGKVLIPAEVVAEVNPTPEAMQLAELLVRGYIRKYPNEQWQMERTEQAVEFLLGEIVDTTIWTCPQCGCYGNGRATQCGKCLSTPTITGEVLPRWCGIAKLDSYFYVPEDTTIESGLHDQRLTLGRGWWAREYKTKSHGIDRAIWAKEWAAKRQADFQLLALEHTIHNTSRDWPPEGRDDTTVRGVLVSVLEKPRDYTPKRKCKGCSNSYELESYLIHADGHMCPMCGYVQKLKPYTPTVPLAPEFYRLIVTRSPEQLAIARNEIAMVAEAMDDLRESGMLSIVPNRDNCISNKYHRQCDFAEQHIAGVNVEEPTFVKIDPYKYIGIQ